MKFIIIIGISIILSACVGTEFVTPECDTTIYTLDTTYMNDTPEQPSNNSCYVTAYTDAVVAVTGLGHYDEMLNLQVWKITESGVVVNGILGTHTPIMYTALQNIPHKKAFILEHIGGSLNDELNTKVGIQLHNDGYTTTVPNNGIVESGGTDFFAAGTQRYFYQGSEIGIHSWAVGKKQANDFPKDHPIHTMYLNFYKAIGISPDFYWLTLQTPAEDMTFMTIPQVQKYLNAILLP